MQNKLQHLARPSLANKLARFTWLIGFLLFFRFSPTPLHGWRRSVLRLFGAKVGFRAVIYPSARIWAPWNLEVADDATIGWHCELYNVAPIRIGRSAILSQHAYLCTATHDLRKEFQLMAAPIDIGTSAWVAAGAFVGPGVTIGEGAVVGARCVATRSVDAWSIVAGNPARPVGTRPVTARNELHAR
jgi:putative colanic acid biosynthesis acetyltransferase WcaF